MKKKLLVVSLTTLTFSLAVTLVALNPIFKSQTASGDGLYHLSLDGSSEVESKDNGYIHQVSYKDTRIDILGYEASNGNFGSIKKATYNSTYTYNGMVYNRSAINGLSSIKVQFSGGSLSYIFSEFLMENMNFDGNALTSNTIVNAPAGSAYFIIYNTSETPVTIEDIDISYTCNGEVDSQMIFNSASHYGSARSYAKRRTLEYNYVELENNPTKYNNNYSTGTGHYSDGMSDVWHRWNGIYFDNSKDLGNEFTFGMTVMGEYSRMVDESKYFHYAVWPQFSFEGCTDDPNDNYVQTYIGNDNYEPLGKDHALHPSDPYVNESYTGRFFSDYVYKNGNWVFCDPDNDEPKNLGMTYREAYEQYNLPFWFIKFHVYLGIDDADKVAPFCDIYINNMLIYPECQIFNDGKYDYTNKPGLFIKTIPLHIINYGIDAEGNPGESYTGTFTYPRLIED